MVVANYTEEGATTKNHRASLKERFDVMRRHYGLLTTVAMHIWFVIRSYRSSFSRSATFVKASQAPSEGVKGVKGVKTNV